ncbi:hydroxyphenylglycine aminotransferase [Kitasatospora sp. SolWspMP-SS2h]|uniref:aminotransferase-like domain-containing protein n=1 Tax=Kitasatospora sp. SolWspMP-SS2h TaxID=1305729 RepID=UPI000DBA904C|nr:PLP-dependent aminotransferase family protein [Kitasatospora sp. SolWspMP-SS2h]RAJ46205.1 hydroxyphenylglycine aminotransferase [Kitasatospora sp. SolWspMP-SS2h]
MTRVLHLADLHGSLSDPLLDAMTFLNEVTARYPEAVSFAPGRPYEEFFDPADVPRHLETYLRHLREERGLTDGQVRREVFQYGRTKGLIAPLIARALAADEGIDTDPEALVVTVGAQEGMLLVLRALCAGPDDVLLVSAPCYVGVTGAARLLDLTVHPVPEAGRDGGLDPAALAAAVHALRAAGKRPRACYVVPDFANPSGASLDEAARRRLLEVAEETGVLLIEDNPYGFFGRTAAARPTLKALDGDRGNVVYLGSFAKTCFPGARVGYVVADQRVAGGSSHVASGGLLADELAKLKSMTTVNTSALSQAVIGGMLLDGGLRLRDANEPARRFYARNMDTLLDALETAFRGVPGVSWNHPDGGFFAVVTVPFRADTQALDACARKHGVLWTPMDGFHPGGGGERQLRLSCSYLTPEEITDGVRRLAAFVAEYAEYAEPGGSAECAAEGGPGNG